MPMPVANALVIPTLGPCRVPSPLQGTGAHCVDDTRRILVSASTHDLRPFLDSAQLPPSFKLAGPRAQLYFNPAQLTCGIVTCGGLCPGVNNVIQSIVLTLTYAYGVRRILGFCYGYAGLASQSAVAPLMLTPAVDAEYCMLLGQHAVHVGLAGRTEMTVSYWNQHVTHVPLALAAARRKQLDPHGDVWPGVLEATGQPAVMLGAGAAARTGTIA